MYTQNQRQQRTSKLIIELNKSGLSYLTHSKFGQAFQYFKQSQKIVQSQLRIDPNNHRINKLAGIVYNNLACYYKKVNKPKISLIYLEKALEIQVSKVEDWAATASTHLNICAIYSFIKDHQSAASHAQLSLNMLDKIAQKINAPYTQNLSVNSGRISQNQNLTEKSKNQEQRSVSNLRMLSHYNLAIQLEHLKRCEASIAQFIKAKQYAKKTGKKNLAIILVCDESIIRMRQQMDQMKEKLIKLVTKKRLQEEKGYYSYMRRNKKNAKSRPEINLFDRKPRGISLYQQKPYYRTNTAFRLKSSPKSNLDELTAKNRNSSFSYL